MHRTLEYSIISIVIITWKRHMLMEWMPHTTYATKIVYYKVDTKQKCIYIHALKMSSNSRNQNKVNILCQCWCSLVYGWNVALWLYEILLSVLRLSKAGNFLSIMYYKGVWTYHCLQKCLGHKYIVSGICFTYCTLTIIVSGFSKYQKSEHKDIK